MEEFRRQIEELEIPYPQKQDLLREIEQDLSHLPKEGDGFTEADLASLREIHTTSAFKIYSGLPEGMRKSLDFALLYSPLILIVFILIREKRMFAFIVEGGIPGMVTLLFLGGVLLGQQVLQAVQLGILKDHSRTKLKLETPTLLIGIAALLTLGLGWSVLGVYVTADSVVKANLSHQILLEGLKESLTPFILSTFLTTLILITHYGTRRLLQLWRAPLA